LKLLVVVVVVLVVADIIAVCNCFSSDLRGMTRNASCRSGSRNIWRTAWATCRQTRQSSALNDSCVKWLSRSPRSCWNLALFTDYFLP